MSSKLTRDRLAEIAQFGFSSAITPANDFEIKELARLVLSAMDSEPVAEVLSNRPGNDTSTIDRALPVGTQLYRHAQPAKDREQVRSEHAEWSQATFGNVGPVGPLKHLSKEALEAAAEPGDLSEWADMQFLLWDAQRRAGITDEQITQAMIEKLAVNKQRKWPAPKDGEPRLHIKEQPAPVLPKSISVRQAISALESADAVTTIGQAYKMGWNHCRAAILQELKKSAGTEAICRSNENVQAVEVQSLTSINPSPDLVSLQKKTESIIGNSPVIPDGYVMVPVEPNGDMLAAAQDAYGETDGDIASTLRAAMLASSPPANRL